MSFIVSGEGQLDNLYCDDSWMFEQFGGDRLWGCGYGGNLANNSSANISSPVQTIAGGTNWKQISSGVMASAAIKTDGTLWVWGINTLGALGDNTRTSRLSPVQTVSAGTNWKQVAASNEHMAAIKTDGTLWTWGNNSYGQLGDNTKTHRSSPVQTVAGGTNWKYVSQTSYHTPAIKTDGTLWLWGNNLNGQLGDNTTTIRISPIQTVAGGNNWKSVSAGSKSGTFALTAAIKTDGTLWTWGDDTYGALGDNTTVSKSSPVQTVAGGTNWKQVSAGGGTLAAIKTDGTLWLAGYGNAGQLGNNTTANKSSPAQTICGGTDWKQVSGSGDTSTNGHTVTAAIKTDGTLWVWGNDTYGQLGDNTTAAKSSPVQTTAGGTNWKQVSVGGGFLQAITFNNFNTAGQE